MKKCIYLDDMKFCKGKCKYGNFCYKHRNLYLLNDGMISKERFTYKMSDYNVRDIKYTLGRLGNLKLRNCKKEEYAVIGVDINEDIVNSLKNEKLHISSSDPKVESYFKNINTIVVQCTQFT